MILAEIVEMLSLQSICFQLMRLPVCLFDVIWESGSYVDNQDRSIVINRRGEPAAAIPAIPDARGVPVRRHSGCNAADAAAGDGVVVWAFPRRFLCDYNQSNAGTEGKDGRMLRWQEDVEACLTSPYPPYLSPQRIFAFTW